MSLVRISMSTESKRQYINDLFNKGTAHFISMKHAVYTYSELICSYVDWGPLEQVFILLGIFFLLLYLKIVRYSTKKRCDVQVTYLKWGLFIAPSLCVGSFYGANKLAKYAIEFLKSYNIYYPVYLVVIILTLDTVIFWKEIISLKECIKQKLQQRRKQKNTASKASPSGVMLVSSVTCFVNGGVPMGPYCW